MTSRAFAAMVGLAATLAATTAAWAATTASITATGSVAATCSVTGDTLDMTSQADGSLGGTKANSAISLVASGGTPIFALSTIGLTEPGNMFSPAANLSILAGSTSLLSSNRNTAGSYDPGFAVNLTGLTLKGSVVPQGGSLKPGSYTLDATLSCTA